MAGTSPGINGPASSILQSPYNAFLSSRLVEANARCQTATESNTAEISLSDMPALLGLPPPSPPFIHSCTCGTRWPTTSIDGVAGCAGVECGMLNGWKAERSK